METVGKFKLCRELKYKIKLEELPTHFRECYQALKILISTFAYFVNPFISDLIKDGFSISEIILF